MLLGTLGASVLGNMLTEKGILRAAGGNKERKGILRAGYGSKKNLIFSHPLTNIEIQKYYRNKSRFNAVYSRDNLLRNIKNGDICNKYWWIRRCWNSLDCDVNIK